MARPLRIEYEGALYHVTGRGNERRKIYFTPADYNKFLGYIKTTRDKYGVILHAYILMTNHYHLIIETPEANLSKIMHHITSGYTMYINKKRKRSGHLFQGRYKSIVVEKDSYLVELSRYIHLNPVRAKMVEKLEDYTYSSYPCYITKKTNDILTTDMILSLQSKNQKDAKRRYKEYVDSGVEEEIENPYSHVYGGMILGKGQFIKEVLKKLKRQYLLKEDISHRRLLHGAVGMEEILQKVAEHYKVTIEAILIREAAEARKVAIYLIRKHTAVTNGQVGEYFGGLSYSGVARIIERLKKDVESDRILTRRIEVIERNMW